MLEVCAIVGEGGGCLVLRCSLIKPSRLNSRPLPWNSGHQREEALSSHPRQGFVDKADSRDNPQRIDAQPRSCPERNMREGLHNQQGRAPLSAPRSRVCTIGEDSFQGFCCPQRAWPARKDVLPFARALELCAAALPGCAHLFESFALECSPWLKARQWQTPPGRRRARAVRAQRWPRQSRPRARPPRAGVRASRLEFARAPPRSRR